MLLTLSPSWTVEVLLRRFGVALMVWMLIFISDGTARISASIPLRSLQMISMPTVYSLSSPMSQLTSIMRVNSVSLRTFGQSERCTETPRPRVM